MGICVKWVRNDNNPTKERLKKEEKVNIVRVGQKNQRGERDIKGKTLENTKGQRGKREGKTCK